MAGIGVVGVDLNDGKARWRIWLRCEMDLVVEAGLEGLDAPGKARTADTDISDGKRLLIVGVQIEGERGVGRGVARLPTQGPTFEGDGFGKADVHDQLMTRAVGEGSPYRARLVGTEGAGIDAEGEGALVAGVDGWAGQVVLGDQTSATSRINGKQAVGRGALIAIGELDLGSAGFEPKVGNNGGLVDANGTAAGRGEAEGAYEKKGRCRS